MRFSFLVSLQSFFLRPNPRLLPHLPSRHPLVINWNSILAIVSAVFYLRKVSLAPALWIASFFTETKIIISGSLGTGWFEFLVGLNIVSVLSQPPSSRLLLLLHVIIDCLFKAPIDWACLPLSCLPLQLIKISFFVKFIKHISWVLNSLLNVFYVCKIILYLSLWVWLYVSQLFPSCTSGGWMLFLLWNKNNFLLTFSASIVAWSWI